MNAYTVKFSEPYAGYPESEGAITYITVVTDRETKAIERAVREYTTEVEGTRLYTHGETFAVKVVETKPLFDGLVLDVDQGY